MENLTVKVTPEVFELLLEFVKSAEKLKNRRNTTNNIL